MPLFKSKNQPFIKKTASLAAMLLMFLWTEAQVYTVDTLMRNGRRPNRINLVYLSDGFLSAELPNFINNATTLNTALFGQTPFLQYKNFFNSFAVRVPSTASGAKHPGTAADESSSEGQPVSNVNTYFQSTFDYFSIHRLLFAENTTGINNVLSANLPDYDQAFMVVNSSFYGGSGGSVATSSINTAASEIAIHEIGHSFADLADEYWAGPQYAAEKPNMTQNSNPATVKWKDWIGKNDISIIAHGPTPPLSTWFKPHPSCKMQFLNYPFCSVCSEAIVTRIHSLTNMIDSTSPSATITLTNNDSVRFEVKLIQMQPAPQILWRVNGINFPPPPDNTSSITVPYSAFNVTNQTTYPVTAEIRDTTQLATGAYIEQFNWTVINSTLPVHITSFSGKINNELAILDWSIENIEDVLFFEVEKSYDGITFIKLAAINPPGRERKYTYTDQNLLMAPAFYRLKVVEKSNSIHYSNVVRLQHVFDKFFYKVYQNADLHTYHLRCVFTEGTKDIAIKIVNANGSLVFHKDFGKVSRQLDFDINLKEKPPGIYFLNITINNQNYTVHLLAK